MHHELDELMAELERLLSGRANRADRVKTFQEFVWGARCLAGGGNVERVLRDLAYDLDFYEADEDARAESPEFYGDARLEREVQTALETLRLLAQGKIHGNT